MKKYIVYIIACLALSVTLSACTAEELEPQKKAIDCKGDSYIGIEPIGPSIPRP